MGKRFHTLLAIAALGLSVYVLTAIAVDASKVKDALQQLGWSGTTAVLALSLINYKLRFYRWQIYVSRLGGRLPPMRHFLYYVSGFAFTISPGKAGEALRSVYLRDHDIEYSKSLAACFSERVLDVVAVLLLASLIAIQKPAYGAAFAIIAAAVITLLVIVRRPGLHGWIGRIAVNRRARVRNLLSSLANVLQSSRRLFSTDLVVIGTLLGLLAWAAEGIGLYLICHSLGLIISPMAAIGTYAISVLVGSAAIFLPSGIGGTEVAMTGLLIEAGATLKAATVATVLCRLATLWFAVLIGLIAAITLEVAPWRPQIRATL